MSEGPTRIKNLPQSDGTWTAEVYGRRGILLKVIPGCSSRMESIDRGKEFARKRKEKKESVLGNDLPVRKTKCATCPFRLGSRYSHLMPTISEAAMQASRICHSTGSNAINKKTGKPEHICRGARDVQLKVMTALKVIAAPTDDEWNATRVEFGMEPQVVKDPCAVQA